MQLGDNASSVEYKESPTLFTIPGKIEEKPVTPQKPVTPTGKNSEQPCKKTLNYFFKKI
jgi:hypothetical protein